MVLSKEARRRENMLVWGSYAKPVWEHVVPLEYRKALASDFKDMAIPGLKKLANNKWQNICLRGGTGIGKTHLATALMRSVMAADSPNFVGVETGKDLFDYAGSIGWVSVPFFLTQIKSTFSRESRNTEQEIIERYAVPKCLVLDDLGAEKSSEFSISSLYVLLSERINRQKKTIITTNLTLEELEEVDQRLASRLAGFSTVILPDRDRRIPEGF